MAFKTNPKQLVERVARNLYGLSARVKVTGCRPNMADNTVKVPATFKQGDYVTHAFINGEVVGMASHRSWRKSYGLLRIEVENAHKAMKATVHTNEQKQ